MTQQRELLRLNLRAGLEQKVRLDRLKAARDTERAKLATVGIAELETASGEEQKAGRAEAATAKLREALQLEAQAALRQARAAATELRWRMRWRRLAARGRCRCKSTSARRAPSLPTNRASMPSMPRLPRSTLPGSRRKSTPARRRRMPPRIGGARWRRPSFTNGPSFCSAISTRSSRAAGLSRRSGWKPWRSNARRSSPRS